jgi:hypothetical protein
VRWASLRTAQYQTFKLVSYIDSVYTVLNFVLPGESTSAQQRNFQRWPVLGQYVWPNYYIGPTFKAEVDWLREWVSNRLTWLDNNMPSVITSVSESHSNLAVSAFPIPFSKEITIEYTLESGGAVDITLYDLLGRSVYSTHERPISAGTYQVNLNTRMLPAGTYYYQVSTLRGSVSGKIIKSD